MRYLKILFVLQFIILTSFNFGQVNNSEPFNLDFTREAILIGTSAAAGVTTLILINNLQPLTPEEINSLNAANVNGFDRGAIGPFTKDYVGDATLYASFLLPLTFLANEEMNKDFLDLAVMYGEVLLVGESINGIIKSTVKRTRPFVYDPNSDLSETTTKDARMSLFSGHVITTAAILFFTAKIFSEYLQDNTAKTLIWCGAIIYPAVTALARVSTHWHFPTDVIGGYVLGALVGYFIPELHKSKSDDSVSIQPSLIPGKSLLNIQIKF